MAALGGAAIAAHRPVLRVATFSELSFVAVHVGQLALTEGLKDPRRNFLDGMGYLPARPFYRVYRDGILMHSRFFM